MAVGEGCGDLPPIARPGPTARPITARRSRPALLGRNACVARADAVLPAEDVGLADQGASRRAAWRTVAVAVDILGNTGAARAWVAFVTVAFPEGAVRATSAYAGHAAVARAASGRKGDPARLIWGAVVVDRTRAAVRGAVGPAGPGHRRKAAARTRGRGEIAVGGIGAVGVRDAEARRAARREDGERCDKENPHASQPKPVLCRARAPGRRAGGRPRRGRLPILRSRPTPTPAWDALVDALDALVTDAE